MTIRDLYLAHKRDHAKNRQVVIVHIDGRVIGAIGCTHLSCLNVNPFIKLKQKRIT